METRLRPLLACRRLLRHLLHYSSVRGRSLNSACQWDQFCSFKMRLLLICCHCFRRPSLLQSFQCHPSISLQQSWRPTLYQQASQSTSWLLLSCPRQMMQEHRCIFSSAETPTRRHSTDLLELLIVRRPRWAKYNTRQMAEQKGR